MEKSIPTIVDIQVRLAEARKKADWDAVTCDEGGGDPPLAARAEASRAEVVSLESELAKRDPAKLP